MVAWWIVLRERYQLTILTSLLLSLSLLQSSLPNKTATSHLTTPIATLTMVP